MSGGAREEFKGERVEVGADGRPALVNARDADGNALAFRPRYVVDASGRDAFLGGKLKLKRKNPRHQSAAVFSHYRGVERRTGRAAGNVRISRHDPARAWLTPLADELGVEACRERVRQYVSLSVVAVP